MENTNQNKWAIDPSHSRIDFKIRHLMISHVHGTFKTFDANIYTTGTDFTTAQIDLWIDAASIATDDEQRDAHLRSEEFFDAAHHKQITFTASTIGKTLPEDNHEMWGELTMRGITKNIKLNVEFGGIVKDPQGREKAGFTITGKINRSDWGFMWNTAMDTGNLVLSDEINISCEIELTKVDADGLKMELKTNAEALTF